MKVIVFALTVLVAAGCTKPDSTPTATGKQAVTTGANPPAVAAVDPHELYVSRCVPCHGASGKGDGPGAAALTPKPRNYTDVAWQSGVKDEDIKRTILYGGAAVGKSATMPANPDLEGKPELDGLVAEVRAFKGK